jgi:AraC-like DNA-binding protein
MATARAATEQPLLLRADRWMTRSPVLQAEAMTIDRPAALHWHEFYEITYVRNGVGVHGLNGQQHRIGEGDLLLVMTADLHEIAPIGGTQLDLVVLMFSEEVLSPLAREVAFHGPRGSSSRAIHLPQVAADADRMVHDSLRSGSSPRLALQATLERIIADIGLSVPSMVADEPRVGSGEPIAHPGMRRALRYIDHHFREPLSLADVASQACLSPNHFSARFHRLTGVSFQRYVQLRRLNFAHALLTSSQLPVTQVGHASGFNDVSHFARCYRRRYNCSPAAARRPDRTSGDTEEMP